jgi:hypothetical protein
MRRTAEIEHQGRDLACTFDYTKGYRATRYEPSEPECAHLIAVADEDGQDITATLSRDDRDEIEAACIQSVHDGRDAARIDAYLARSES